MYEVKSLIDSDCESGLLDSSLGRIGRSTTWIGTP